jgi:hypothetical protein
MCKAFSGICLRDKSVIWKFGVDSHTSLCEQNGLKDNSADPMLMEFFKFEITPKNNSYLNPNEWVFRVDEQREPAWLTPQHKEACFVAHKGWLRKLNKILVRKEIIHPFKLEPPKKITEKHVRLLRQWARVRASVRASVGARVWDNVWASVRASVGASVGDSVGDSVWARVWANVGDSVRARVWARVWANVRPCVGARVRASVGASVWDRVRASVGASVGDRVRASVGDSVWDNVWDSVGDSVWAYTGSFFNLPKWQHVKHAKGKYPFEPCVQLWECGLVPSFDGKTWRLHGGPKGAILFEISADKLAERKATESEGG